MDIKTYTGPCKCGAELEPGTYTLEPYVCAECQDKLNAEADAIIESYQKDPCCTGGLLDAPDGLCKGCPWY